MQKFLNSERYQGMAYQVFGEGPVACLLHGFGEDATIWKYQIPVLSKKYQLVVPDWPGCGFSMQADPVNDLNDLAASVHEILHQEGISQCLFFGHSMGGYTALAFARNYPACCTGISLVHSSAYADDEQKKENRVKAIRLIEGGGKEVFLKAMIPNLYSEQSKTSGIPDKEAHLTMAQTIPSSHLTAYYEAMIKRPDSTDVLKMNLPFQFILGEEDQAAPMKHGLEQCSIPDRSIVHCLQNTGHTGMFECPDAVNAIMYRFLEYVYG